MPSKKKNKTTVPLQIIDMQEEGYHPLVDITVFGKPFILVLDTGASKTAFDENMVKDEGQEFILSDMLSTGLGTNSMSSSTATINNLYIGGLLIEEFEVAVLDLSAINTAYAQLGYPEVLGVLGGDILMKYKAVINYGKKRLVLKS